MSHPPPPFSTLRLLRGALELLPPFKEVMEKARVIQLGVHNLEEVDPRSFVGQALKKLNLNKIRPDSWGSHTITVPLKLPKKSTRKIKRITVYADEAYASTSADAETLELDDSQETKTELTQESSETKTIDSLPSAKPRTSPVKPVIPARLPFTSTKLVEVKSTHSSYPERKPAKKKGTKGVRTNASPKRLSIVRDNVTDQERKSLQRRTTDPKSAFKKHPAGGIIRRRALRETSPSKERLQSFISHFKATGRAMIEQRADVKQFKFREPEQNCNLSEVEIELMLYETEKAAEQIEFQVDLWNQIEKSNLLAGMNEEIRRAVKNGSILLNAKLSKARELILKHKESLEDKKDRKKGSDVSFLSVHHEMTQRDFRSVMKMFENLENSLSKSETSLSALSNQYISAL